MANWHDITRDEEYQSLSPQAKLDLKQRFFERTFGADKEFEGLSEPAKQALFQNFMQTPDDTGQGYISSMAGSAARGFGEVVPGTIEGVGALTGIQPIREAGQAVRSGLEYIAPVNPLYQEDVAMKLANVGGNIASVLATGGVGGAAGRALSAERIAAGASQAARQQLSRQAVERGAKAALYGTGAAQGAAEGATEAERYGMTGGDAYLRTLAGSIGAVGAEALPFGTALETALPRRLLGAGGEAAQGIRRAAATEGVEEMGTQFVGNVATEALAPEGVETPGLTEGLAEAGALGAFGGALFGGIGKLTQFDKQTQIQRDLSAEAAAMPVDSVPDQTDEEKRANMEKGYQLVVDPEGKTAYVPQQVSPEVLAGLSPQEQADLGFTPPAAPTPAAEVPPVAEEPPPVAAPTPAAAPPVVEEPVLPQVANDTAIRSFENVEANADVAPATAAVLEEIALNENTPEVALETEASGVVPTVPQEGVASSGEIPVQETELTGAAAGSSGGGMKRDKSKTEQMTLDEATERVWPLNKNTQYAPKDGVANLNGMPAVKSNGAWMFTHPTFGRSPVLSPREISRLDHQLIIQDALSQKKPVAVESVDWYDVPLPLGYTRQDDLYVYKPQPPTPNAPTEIPIQESLRGEPQGGTEIRQRQEAGTGNRVLGAAPVQAGEVPGQVAGPAAAATAQAAATAKPLTETQARDILTKRFGKQVADKMVVAEFPAVALREGEQPVEVDAFLQGGKVHLNLKFIDSEEMLVSKAEHEMAHAVWSNPNVQKAWSALRASMPEDVRQRITKNVTELGYNLAQVDEETMVRFFEEVRASTPPQKWKAFMDAVIDALRRFLGMAPDERTARLAAARIIAEAESAVARGLDPLQAAFGMSIPRAVIEKLDAEYMAAVEAGDMKKAQRMVDEAAKAVGTVWDVGDGKMYHGTRSNFDVMRTPAFFSPNPEVIYDQQQENKQHDYGDQIKSFFLFGKVKYGVEMPEYTWGVRSVEDDRIANAEDEGYDIVELVPYGDASGGENSFFVAINPSVIKSADPVTYDDQGNVIPLSQRFDLRSPDIRYSLRQQDRLRSQDWRMEDAAINLQERRPQQETINEASKIIGDFLKDADDPFLARRKAFQFLLSDPNLRPETRVAGLGLLAQQMDMVANLKKRAGRDSDADLYDDEVNRAIAAEEILKNDPTSWQNLKFDIDAALANYSRDGALMLNILNAFRRLTPEGFVRRMERAVRKNLDQTTTAETGKTTDQIYNEVSKAAKEPDPEKAIERLIKEIQGNPNSTAKARSVLPPLLQKIIKGAQTGAIDRIEFQEALAKAFNVPVLTKQQADEFTDLVRRIRALPEGVLQDDLKKELNAKMAMFDGIPAVDMLTSAWYANILSGLPTLLLQGTGNAFNTGLQSFLAAISSNPADTIQGFRGAFTSGLKQGLNEAMLALQGRSQFKPTATTDRNTISNLEILGRYGPKSWTDTLAYISSAGTLTKYVFRLFSAIDAFFQSTAREGHAYLAASKAARKVGKIGSPEYNAEFIKQIGGDTREFEAYLERAKEEQKKSGLPYDRNKIVQRAFELRSKERPATINALSDRFANRITFTGKPEGIGRVISNFISAVQRFTVGGIPIGRLLLPFNQIVSNIFEQSLDYLPIIPVGAARGILGGHLSDIEWVRGKARLRQGAVRFDPLERRQRIAASILGTTVGVLAYALADSFKDESDEDVPFMIYGQGPSDKNKREALTRMGWSPNSIKIGDTFYRYSEYPLAMVFSAFGSAMDAERYEKLDKKDSIERAQYVLMSAIKGMLNQGVLTNLKKTFEVLAGDAPIGSLADMPVSAVKGLIPTSGLLKDVATIMDPTKISADTIRAAILRDIPFAKEYAGKPELNVFGEPVKFTGLPVIRRVAVQRVSDHVSDWMGRNFLTVPGMERTIEIGQYFPKDTKSWIQRKALQMGAAENGMFTSDQNYRFKERAGKLTKAAIESLMTLKKNPRPQERAGLQKVINREVEKARKKAMLEIVKEDYL